MVGMLLKTNGEQPLLLYVQLFVGKALLELFDKQEEFQRSISVILSTKAQIFLCFEGRM